MDTILSRVEQLEKEIKLIETFKKSFVWRICCLDEEKMV